MQIKHTVAATLAAICFGLWWTREDVGEKKSPPPPPISSEASLEELPKDPPPRPSKKNTPTANTHALTKKPPVTSSVAGSKYPGLDDSFAPFDKDGNLYISQITVQGKNLTFHGDLLLGHTKDLEKFKKMKQIKLAKPRLWPGGKVPYTIDGTAPHPERIEEAIESINLHTNIRFVERSEETDYIHFTTGEQNCYSYVGKVGGPQDILLSEACQVRDILHEILHAIGFFHEQNRGDRDDFISILWENIPEVHKINFKKFPMEFMHLREAQFSYDSLMMYPSSAFSGSEFEPTILKKDGDLIHAEGRYLSEEDVRRVNQVYPFQ